MDPTRFYVDHGLTDRPGLREALAACRSGETLVVTKFDRVARSVLDASDMVDELSATGVRLNIGGRVHDPTDPIGWLLFTTLSRIAEFEADFATREGMGVARGPGRLRGKQPNARQAGCTPRRGLPHRRTHDRRAGRALPGYPVDDLPGGRAGGRRTTATVDTERDAMTDLIGRTARGAFGT